MPPSFNGAPLDRNIPPVPKRAGIDEIPWEVWRRWLYELHYADYGGPGALGVVVRVLAGQGNRRSGTLAAGCL